MAASSTGVTGSFRPRLVGTCEGTLLQRTRLVTHGGCTLAAMKIVVTIGVLVGVLSGCGPHSAPVDADATNPIGDTVRRVLTVPTSRPSARPRNVNLVGIPPCAVVPQAAWAEFDIDRAVPEEDPDLKAPVCFLNSSHAALDVMLVTTEGIEVWTADTRYGRATETPPIQGFPAVSIMRVSSQYDCHIAVDMARGQYVLVGAVIDLNDRDQLDRCSYARQLAYVVVTELLHR